LKKKFDDTQTSRQTPATNTISSAGCKQQWNEKATQPRGGGGGGLVKNDAQLPSLQICLQPRVTLSFQLKFVRQFLSNLAGKDYCDLLRHDVTTSVTPDPKS